MVSGVYRILNSINGMVYIGSAINIYNRFKNHKIELRLNHHYNSYLQNAWNKYGEINFKFEIVQTTLPIKKDIIEAEQHWLDETQCCDRNIGYNLCLIAGSPLGFKHSLETFSKLSFIRTGKPRSEETKQRISNTLKGRVFSEKTKIKMSDAHKGHKHTKDFKEGMSKRLIGNKFNLGRKQTPEHKAAILAAKKKSAQNRKIDIDKSGNVWA